MNFGKSANGSNHQSFVARLGEQGQKWTDPLAWIFGDKYTGGLVKIADKSNGLFAEIGKPFTKIDKTINPVRKIPVVDHFANWTEQKPVDTAAIAAAIYGGGAAAGGGGGGAAGGGGGGAAGGGGGGAAGGGGGGAAAGGAGGGSSGSGFSYQKFLANGLKGFGQQQQQAPQYIQTDINGNYGQGVGGGYYA